MAKDDLERGVFGDVLREDRERHEQARPGRSTGRSGARRPEDHDAFDELVQKKPDPDRKNLERPGRVKLR